MHLQCHIRIYGIIEIKYRLVRNHGDDKWSVVFKDTRGTHKMAVAKFKTNNLHVFISRWTNKGFLRFKIKFNGKDDWHKLNKFGKTTELKGIFSDSNSTFLWHKSEYIKKKKKKGYFQNFS